MSLPRAKPDNPWGVPEGDRYLSWSQLSAYGGDGLPDDLGGAEWGCPRRYRARYVDGVRDPETPEQRLGTVVHRALELMEADGRSADDALAVAAGEHPGCTLAQVASARRMIEDFLSRPGPHDRVSVARTEAPLAAVLYRDDEGPVWYVCVLDWLGVDPDDPGTLHIGDYKTSARPPSRAEARRGQLRGYAWAALQDWPGMAVVCHLEALAHYTLSVRFTPADIEDWAVWAEAGARAIVAEDQWAPRLGRSCPGCEVRFDCPAWASLPDTAAALTARPLGDLAQQWRWREAAANVAGLLAARISEIDQALADEARALDAAGDGPLVLGGTEWSVGKSTQRQVDVPAAVEVWPDIIEVAKVPIGALEDIAAGLDASTGEQLLACIREVGVDEPKVTRRKAKQ